MPERIKQLKEAEQGLKVLIKSIDFQQMDLISFNEVAPILCEFGRQVLLPLQVDHIKALTQRQPISLQRQIQETKEAILGMSEHLDQQVQLYQELLDKEADLEEKQRQFANFTDRIKKIQELERLVGDLDLKTPEEKITELEGETIKAIVPLKNKLKRFSELLNSENNEILQSTKHNSGSLLKIQQQLEETQKNVLFELQDGLKLIKSSLPKFNKRHNELVQDYNLYLNKLRESAEQIDEIENVHLKNVQIYQRHFRENEKIWGKLGEPTNAINYVKGLVKETGEKLEEFDSALRKLVEQKRDKIYYETPENS